MDNYTKQIQDNKIIFKDILNKKELVVNHYDEDYHFDTVFIDESMNTNFILYVIKELKKTNDLSIVTSLCDSPIIDDVLINNGLRVLNYQYTIDDKEYLMNNNYDISNVLDDESKNFYLEKVNEISRANSKYLNLDNELTKYNDKIFEIEEFYYRVYREDKNIVGIVDYKVIDNKLFIRSLLCINEQVIEDIIKDLLNVYKKDLIISITYSENNIREIIKKLNGKFNYCMYKLIDE